MTIPQYTQKLQEILGQTLAAPDVEEVIAETTSHLSERAEELRSMGHTSLDAEQQAVLEFGEVSEIAPSIAKEFPPKPPINPDRLKWMPEVLVAFLAVLAFYSFSQSRSVLGPMRALESAVLTFLGSTPMMVIPGLFAALSRIKFRRFRIVSVVWKLATYGACLAILGIATLCVTRVTTQQAFTALDTMYAGFAAVTIAGYGAMRFLAANGKLQKTFFKRFKPSR